jgi:P4 family phage/plasmid primase-like protien
LAVLEQICRRNNLSTPFLTTYVQEREKCLKEIVDTYQCLETEDKVYGASRENAKTLFIRLVYLGKFDTWYTDLWAEVKKRFIKDGGDEEEIPQFEWNSPTDFIAGLIAELKDIANYIKDNNPDLYEAVKKHKKVQKDSGFKTSQNLLSSTMSYYLQDIERRILETIYKLAKSKGIIKDEAVLCADGMMVPTKNYSPELLTLFKKEVKDKLDLDVNFSSKDMNQDILQALEDESNYLPEEEFKAWEKTKQESEVYNPMEFWNMISNLNQMDIAKWYYDEHKHAYIYSDRTGWYEYNSYSVLVPKGMEAPSSLLYSVSSSFQDLVIKQRNSLAIPKTLDDKEEYDKKMKALTSAYNKVGQSGFSKGVLSYLTHLYHIENIDDKLDSKPSLLAFQDQVADLSICDFRPIQPDDYITKTCKRKAPTCQDVQKEEQAKALVYSVFEDDSVVEYWLATTALSLFGNRGESFFIHTGAGGNGKGLLSDVISKCIGDYFYTAENTFLTTPFKAGAPNPTLANAKGVRWLCISEPDDGKDSKLNVDFIKTMTGKDTITTRALYKDNISYIPQFTPHMQCNNTPDLGKLDNGIKRRLKLIPYPLNFVEEHKISKPNDRRINTNLKDELNRDDFLDAFTRLLLKYAYIYNAPGKSIPQPKQVEKGTAEYFDECNPIKAWVVTNLDFSNPNYREKASALLARFTQDTGTNMSAKKFKEVMKFNGYEPSLHHGISTYKGIRIKEYDEIAKEEEQIFDNEIPIPN